MTGKPQRRGFRLALFGIRSSVSPFLTLPDSILPIAIVPSSLYFSDTGSMNGALMSRSMICRLSRNSRREGPLQSVSVNCHFR